MAVKPQHGDWVRMTIVVEGEYRKSEYLRGICGDMVRTKEGRGYPTDQGIVASNTIEVIKSANPYQDVLECVRTGQKIQAIKCLRQTMLDNGTQMGLREAKQLVELMFEATNSEVRDPWIS